MSEETSSTAACDAEAGLRLLYEENGRVAATFFEWRHKVILLCSTVLTLSFGAVSWMFDERLGGIVMAIPLLFGSLVAAACRQFDRRNGRILHDCFEAGADLEAALSAPSAGSSRPNGIYTRMVETRKNPKPYDPPKHTYGRALWRGYAAISFLLLVLAAVLVVVGITTPHFLLPPSRR
jgi:hypothetical protein